MGEALEMWALRNGVEAWTENGRLVATFTSPDEAAEVVEEHNIEVEIERDEPTPEDKRTAEQRTQEIVADWRRHHPDGLRLLASMREAVARLERLASLRAPQIILASQAASIADRGVTIRAFWPEPPDDDEQIAIPSTPPNEPSAAMGGGIPE